MKIVAGPDLKKWVIIILAIVAAYLLIANKIQKRKTEKAQIELRTYKIRGDSLQKLSDGFYRKLLADTLTQKQLNKLAQEVTDLKNRKPIIVEKTIIRPEYIEKEIDGIYVDNDSISIVDYYPQKENPFLEYTNKFSITTQKGNSQFKFNPIELNKVVTEKDGLYTVDFKGPEWLQVESLDIQARPLAPEKKDRFGILFGVDYGKNLNTNQNIIGIDSYIRFNKFYLGGGINSQGDLKGGIKIEL